MQDVRGSESACIPRTQKSDFNNYLAAFLIDCGAFPHANVPLAIKTVTNSTPHAVQNGQCCRYMRRAKHYAQPSSRHSAHGSNTINSEKLSKSNTSKQSERQMRSVTVGDDN
jgi:hypothetical protein